MKKKSLFAALFITIILISSCVMGVEENERASVSFKLETTVASRNTGTDAPSYEGHYIVVSIKDAETKRVIISQTLPRDATSCTFDEIQVGLTIIGKVEFFYGGDKPEETFRSLPHTVKDGENILTALLEEPIHDLIGTWVSSDGTKKWYMTFTESNIIQRYSIKHNNQETIYDEGITPYTVVFDGLKATVTLKEDYPSFVIIFDDDKNSGTTEDGMIFTKYIGDFPSPPTTTGLSDSDLHGTWTGTDTYKLTVNDENIGTVTEKETYTFDTDSYTKSTEMLESTYTGSEYPWAVKGYRNTKTYNRTKYEVNGAEITVLGHENNSQNNPPTKISFLFLNGAKKDAVVMYGVLYTKQQGSDGSDSTVSLSDLTKWTWVSDSGTADGDTKDYMTFTDVMIIIQGSIMYNGYETGYDSSTIPYTNISFNGLTATIELLPDPDEPNAPPPSIVITFNKDKTSATYEEGMTFTEYVGQLPGATTTGLSSDLYGTWEATVVDRLVWDMNNNKATVTEEETYIFNADTYTLTTNRIKSSNLTYFPIETTTSPDINITYSADGATVTVTPEQGSSSVGDPMPFTFLNNPGKEAAVMYSVLYKKQP